jgi:hypothetical protein
MLSYLLLPIAAVLAVGAAAGAFAYVALAKLIGFLRASERPMRAEDYELAGTLARVTVPAAAGGVGEIVLTLNGVQRVEGCREAGGGALGKGVEVVITGTARCLALAGVDKVTIVSAGDGKGGGASALTGEVARMVAQLPEVVETITGYKVGELLDRVKAGAAQPARTIPIPIEDPKKG